VGNHGHYMFKRLFVLLVLCPPPLAVSWLCFVLVVSGGVGFALLFGCILERASIAWIARHSIALYKKKRSRGWFFWCKLS
jgi:hypothetical protein